MTTGANTAGGWFAGAIPHRLAGGTAIHHVGFNAQEMLHKPRKAYVLLNVEPEDCANSSIAIEAFKHAKCVVALSTYRNSALEEYADVILPITPFTETAGTFINAAGDWQQFNGVAKTFAASRPAWKVLRVLGNFLHLGGFEYESAEQIHHEVKALTKQTPEATDFVYQPGELNTKQKEMISRIGEIPIYSTDGLVRRSQPLQDAQILMEADVASVRIHPDMAAKLNLIDGEVVQVKQQSGMATLPVKVDARVAMDAAWIAAGITATRTLGDLFGEIEIYKE
jgi:NADH-quinone oxidoreductase subunit G